MEYRIVVLGAGGSGTSELIKRYIMGTAEKRYDPMSEDSYRKQVEIDGKICILNITATAGMEEWISLRDQYISSGDGYVLAYTVTSAGSLAACGRLRSSIQRSLEQDNIPIILVGTQCDLENDRVVSTSDGRELAEKWNSAFIEASAKTDKNINQIFIELVRLIDKWREAQAHDDKKVKTKRRAWTLL